jgi:PadR family transcriptional regulator PadR
MTEALARVAIAMMSDPNGRFYGYDLSRQARVRSGVLYPILDRMLRDGWIADEWELPSELTARRPRRYYTLTEVGRDELGGIRDRALLTPRFAPMFGRVEGLGPA